MVRYYRVKIHIQCAVGKAEVRVKVLFMYDHCVAGKVKRGEPRRDSERSDKADSVTEDILEKYRGTSAKPPVSSSNSASGMCIYFCRSYNYPS